MNKGDKIWFDDDYNVTFSLKCQDSSGNEFPPVASHECKLGSKTLLPVIGKAIRTMSKGETATIQVNATQPGFNAPAVFKVGTRQYAAALFPDNATFALPANAIPGVPSRAAKPGETLTLYGVGFGAVTPTIPAGQVTGGTNALASPLTLSIAGTRATVSYAGLAPGAVGLYQVNFTVPAVPANDAAPLTFTLGGAAGAQTLFIAVGN